MQKREFINILTKTKVVPVIRHKDPDVAYRGAKLLAEAGFPVLEMTFTVPGAADLITRLSGELPNAIVGAGTVLTDLQVHHAIKAGAQFVVSPCWTYDAAEVCIMDNIPYLPGAATPGEVLHHWQNGALAVKVFPAHETGGPGFLKAVKAVFPDIPLMPTGGVKPEQVADYLRAGAICAGLGGDLFPAAALEAGDDDAAREQIAKARSAMALDQPQA
ncbi:MAG TPA: bifunctional 4-hydroxy-2-oxoglutarate aldolase/2-dehydro-3-deoxy-phosphogluconate aldolase [Hyphomicrobiales bacterium]|nr:bifunctional 4-hydroxy-2-oxoglutarate aldolase/2-dehydro-3-deoxy-phosphogluconate aldolase [Hyphomicrobiales bacterium]